MSTGKKTRAGSAAAALVGFVATVRLSTKDNRTLALPGQVCAKVPAESIPHLLAHDPPQIVAAAVWDRLTPDQQDWLNERTARNLAWRDDDPEGDDAAVHMRAALLAAAVEV